MENILQEGILCFFSKEKGLEIFYEEVRVLPIKGRRVGKCSIEKKGIYFFFPNKNKYALQRYTERYTVLLVYSILQYGILVF